MQRSMVISHSQGFRQSRSAPLSAWLVAARRPLFGGQSENLHKQALRLGADDGSHNFAAGFLMGGKQAVPLRPETTAALDGRFQLGSENQRVAHKTVIVPK